MGVCVDVGIDPNGDTCRGIHFACNRVDDLEFGHRFHIEASDVVADAGPDFPVGFAHARVGHFRGRNAGGEGGFDFMSADQVGTQAGLCYLADNAWIAVGLDRIVHTVRPVGSEPSYFGQCRAQHVKVVVVERRRRQLEDFHRETMVVMSCTHNAIHIFSSFHFVSSALDCPPCSTFRKSTPMT